MMRMIREMLDIWPTTQQALEQNRDCVRTGRHSYTVKNDTGAVEAVRCEIVQMQRLVSSTEPEVTRCTGKMLSSINQCTLPYPKNLFFGQDGALHVAAVSYNVNIADMMDM